VKEKWQPPCMNPDVKTVYPQCKMTARNGKDGTCSILVAIGCHGFYPTSNAAKLRNKPNEDEIGKV